MNNGRFVTGLQGFTADDRLCIPVPFYHCFGMVMGNLGSTSHGATMVIPGDAFDAFKGDAGGNDNGNGNGAVDVEPDADFFEDPVRRPWSRISWNSEGF